jgi:hypothetical protein
LLGKKLKEILEEKYLFSMSLKLENDLNKGSISKDLKDVFKTEALPLSENATIAKQKKDEWIDEWIITDKEKSVIRKEGGKLNIYGNKILDKVERQDCDVHGLTEHFKEKYDHYHEHAEIYIELCEPSKKFPKNKREEFLHMVARLIGESAGNSDKDLKEKLKGMGIYNFYSDPLAKKFKYWLGTLALENGVHFP